MRHGLLVPPMYGMPGGLGRGGHASRSCSRSPGYVTQAVGKWHMGENTESQPQNVGFDDFYGFLSVSDMYTEWRDPYFFPEVVYNEDRTEWVRNMPFNKCFVHTTRGGTLEEVEEVTVPVLSLLDDKWCRYSEAFIERMATAPDPWFLYHCTRARTSTTTRTPTSSVAPRPGIPTRTPSSSWTTSAGGSWAPSSARVSSSPPWW